MDASNSTQDGSLLEIRSHPTTVLRRFSTPWYTTHAGYLRAERRFPHGDRTGVYESGSGISVGQCVREVAGRGLFRRL